METKDTLNARIAQLESMLEIAQTGLTRLQMYASHSKFNTGGGIAVMDVDLRIREIRSEIADEECVPFGWRSNLKTRRLEY